MTQIVVKPQGWLGLTGDALMLPFMLILGGSAFDAPQRTHKWNNRKLTTKEEAAINTFLTKTFKGRSKASPRFISKLPIFHMPIFGGWREYVVLSCDVHTWYIGWKADDVSGISRVPLTESVRVLIGPGEVSFFAVDAFSYEQAPIHHIGNGTIGTQSDYSRLPLR